MFRRIAFVGGAVALTFAAFVPSSNAAVPKIDVSGSEITCNTLVATAGVKPALVSGGTATSVQITLKGILNGCSVTAGNTATILKSSFSGKLVASTNSCDSLAGPPAPLGGTLTVKWKADKTTPLLQTSTVITGPTLQGGVFSSVPWGAAYGQFDLTGGATTGAFAAGGGSGNHTIGVTSQDIVTILGGCNSPTGVKSLNLGLGQLHLGV